MGSRTFGDLLSRADKLSSTIHTPHSSLQWTPQPPQQHSLNQIFDRGENLLSRARGSAQTPAPSAPTSSTPQTGKKDPLSSLTSTLSTATRLPASPQRASQTLGPGNREVLDLNAFLKNDREETLMSLIDETLRDAYEDAERAFEREQLKYVDQYKFQLQNVIPTLDFNAEPALKTSKVQKYTDKVLEGSTVGGQKLVHTLLNASKSLRDNGHPELWKQVSSMLSVPVQKSGVAGRKDPADLRSSPKFQLDLNNQALICLQEQFVEHMEGVVFGNLEKARQGGIPGTYAKVMAYLNVKLPSNYPGAEDGLCERHPVWAVVYYCMRAGDIKTALEVCEKSGPQMREYLGIFREVALSETARLSSSNEMKVRSEYKRIAHTCSDPFKRGVLCWLSPCDSLMEFREIEDKLEDWLWGRLVQTRHWERLGQEEGTLRAPGEPFRLKDLQKKIFEEYGEKHFRAGESALLYFTALWVTGQFEAALEFLSRQGDVLRCHAVHAALAAQEAGLLITPPDVKMPLAWIDKQDPSGVMRLNLSRLILMYTSKFDMTDPREALNYFYFLRHFVDGADGNLFVSSLSELVRKSKEYAMLLGRIEPDGCRKPGAIDKFDQEFDSSALIESVARDCEREGKKEEAVRLYDLAGDHDKVMRLLSNILSQLASQAYTNPDRQRFADLAVSIASRYRQQGSSSSEGVASTFYLMMDVVTFFEMTQIGDTNAAIEVMRKLRIVPLSPEEVDRFVNAFHMVPEEVRILLADIMVGVMQALNEEYRKLKASTTTMDRSVVKEMVDDIRRKGKALIMYGGLIPYRLPGDATGRLVQLELLLH